MWTARGETPSPRAATSTLIHEVAVPLIKGEEVNPRSVALGFMTDVVIDSCFSLGLECLETHLSMKFLGTNGMHPREYRSMLGDKGRRLSRTAVKRAIKRLKPVREAVTSVLEYGSDYAGGIISGGIMSEIGNN